MTPSISWSRRENTAISSASITSAVVIDAAVRHPTIMREWTSMMNAVNTNPDHVAT